MQFKRWLVEIFEVPSLWYHGSNVLFDRIENQKGSVVHSLGEEDVVINRPLFFSKSPAFAKLNGKYVYRCNLSVKKLFDHKVLWDDSVDSQWEDDHYTALAVEMYEHFIPKGDYSQFINGIIRGDWDVMEKPAIVHWIWSKGFDAFSVTGDGEENIAIKSSKQVSNFEVLNQ